MLVLFQQQESVKVANILLSLLTFELSDVGKGYLILRHYFSTDKHAKG